MTHAPGESDACRELAAYLTGSEARQLADRLEAGQPMSMAVGVIAHARSSRVQSLITAGGLRTDRPRLLSVLRAVEGAHSGMTVITPVWTAPGHLAGNGKLTSSIHHYVDRARESVICSTFNFQRSSALWTALAGAAARPEVGVRIYMDRSAADKKRASWKPSTREVARAMQGAVVFRTTTWSGQNVVNHAKFIAIDHQFLVVMSANFSKSAEYRNVELGLVIEDPLITQAVERQMGMFETTVYERVSPSMKKR